MNQKVTIVRTKTGKPSKGTAGLESQCMGQCVTVSSVANVTGGIGAGKIITVTNK